MITIWKKLRLPVLLSVFLFAGIVYAGVEKAPGKESKTREPAFAGKSYPAEEPELRALIEGHLKEAPSVDGIEDLKKDRLLGLIVPHYWPYALKTAAVGFKQLEGRRIKTVVILCNYHGKPFPGIKVDDSAAWRTPLGVVKTDRELAEKLVAGDSLVSFDGAPHPKDHTVENLLPFLQCLLKNKFRIVPVLFGNSYTIGKDMNEDYKVMAGLLAQHLGANDLVIVSNDMSHFFPYEGEYKDLDKETMKRIESADIQGLFELEKKVVKKLEKQGDTGRRILTCAGDGIKTLLELYNTLKGGGTVKVLDYGVRVHESKTFVGFCSVAVTKEVLLAKNQ